MPESPDPEIARLARECGELRVKVAELESFLRLCAVFTCSTTGDEETDTASAIESADASLLDIPDLVSDRFADRECLIARLESERDAAVAEAERVERLEALLRRCRDALPYSVLWQAIDAALKGDHFADAGKMVDGDAT